jgi:hypothetical protein
VSGKDALFGHNVFDSAAVDVVAGIEGAPANMALVDGGSMRKAMTLRLANSSIARRADSESGPSHPYVRRWIASSHFLCIIALPIHYSDSQTANLRQIDAQIQNTEKLVCGMCHVSLRSWCYIVSPHLGAWIFLCFSSIRSVSASFSFPPILPLAFLARPP